MASKDKDKKPNRTYRRRSGNVRTLADLNRQTGPDSDSDPEDAPKKHYTGGNNSGRMVQDPTKGNGADSILDQAKQTGAVEHPFDEYTPPSSSSRSFVGTPRSLSGPASPEPVPLSHDIVFWHNGFTVNNGQLRRMDDPKNASFLASVRNSEIPKELEPTDKNSPVQVNLIKQGEAYVEPSKRRRVAFEGKGRTLGSSTSAFSFEPSGSASPPAFSLVIDETKPITSIQFRLADGGRMVERFNLDHTINDIRGFIESAMPGVNRNYELQAVGFPPKLLNDPNQTIEEAGIANSVVIQKL